MSEKIIGVLGLGIFGTTLAEKLAKFGEEVIAIDNKPNHVQDIADSVSKAILGDITNIETLKEAGIDQCQQVIIATGNNLESSVLAIMHCKKLGVPYIAAKAKNATFEEVLYEIGANRVISPERESGRSLASTLMRHRIHNIFYLEEGVSIIEFELPESWQGKELNKLKLRDKYDLNVIGYRLRKNASLTTDIQYNTIFPEQATIVAVASSDTFEKYDYLNYLK
ncbi:potassium channel family protein [Streptococcus downei]|uniref:Trk system potassium uptake protein n=1 Tax=Streptococcus downei MFe28 TaxID=764290 RepID=A0A380JER9_STRDO|nr:TrkA family potassium uptake protein [Streptococcus downei]EFQ56378.1 TrkA N-terminal domain protein [Streptococcus downei F0415]SUN35860.1 trk system potassium uptake protein [Streptococcus downei MFe28]